MKEQTGDLKDLREKKFREINTDLKHLSELSFDELKHLYNELCASKKDYIKYMTKIEIKKDKWCRFIKYFIIALNTLILAGLIIEGTSLIEIFMGMSLISLTCLDGYRKFRNIPEEIALDNYQSSLIKINDLILEKEKKIDKTLDGSKEEALTETRYGYTLSSIFPTPEIEEIAMKVVRDKNEQDLKDEQELTLKRDLTKKNN